MFNRLSTYPLHIPKSLRNYSLLFSNIFLRYDYGDSEDIMPWRKMVNYFFTNFFFFILVLHLHDVHPHHPPSLAPKNWGDLKKEFGPGIYLFRNSGGNLLVCETCVLTLDQINVQLSISTFCCSQNKDRQKV